MTDAADVVVGVPVGGRTIAQVITEAKRLGQELLGGELLQGGATSNHDVASLQKVYFLYRRTAEEMVVRIGPEGVSAHDQLKEALTEAAAMSKGGDHLASVYRLQQVFMEMSGKAGATRSVQLDAMPAPSYLLAERYADDALAENYPKGSVEIKLSTLRGAIAMATQVAKKEYDLGNGEGACYILNRAVADMTSHLDPADPDGAAAIEALRMDAPPDKAALELIRALKALANRPSNPSLAAGMKSPVEFMVEPDYPEMEAKKGGCCLVS